MDKLLNGKMFNDLINIQDNESLGKCTSARELYKILGLKKRFGSWIEQYVKEDNKYRFKENEDFTSVLASTLVNNGAKRELQDYLITLDMAKEISMITGTEIGSQVRKYFIQMEKYIIQTNQEEQFKKFREQLDILEKEKEVYIKDSNFYPIKDIRELLGGSIEIDTDRLKEMSCKLGLSIKQEEGYFNSKLTYYNRYHFLVWVEAYKDIFEIASDEKLKAKNAYDELNNVNNL